ncbi:MAG: hypothetical protein AABX10_01010 [Nanoarchaeota archaeon]
MIQNLAEQVRRYGILIDEKLNNLPINDKTDKDIRLIMLRDMFYSRLYGIFPETRPKKYKSIRELTELAMQMVNRSNR